MWLVMVVVDQDSGWPGFGMDVVCDVEWMWMDVVYGVDVVCTYIVHVHVRMWCVMLSTCRCGMDVL